MKVDVLRGHGKYSMLCLLACLIVAECAPSPVNSSTLRYVNMLYRHGDRSPVYVYPTDKHQVWPDGLGWLTNIGKMQQYKLGKYLRGLYGGFINVTRYNHEELIVEASAVQRCLMSAYSNLAGFFPPQGDQEWNSQLLWQPIPVLTVPQAHDNKLAMGAECPRYNQLLAEEFVSKEVLAYQAKNKEFLEYVANNTGVVKESLSNLWQVGDTLVCEKAHNLTWNDWAYKNGTYEQLEALVEFGWDLLYKKPEMAKLKGGPLLKEMIANMKTAQAQPNSPLKMHIYSAHDSTVAALLNAMAVFNNRQPPYRTVVMVELHEINGGDFVKIYLRNETTHDRHYLLPHGCEDPCKLSTFEAVMAPRVPIHWEAECEAKIVNAAPQSLSIASYIAFAIGGMLAVTMVVGLVIMMRRRSDSYSQL